jgi:hypothetical protein
MPLFKTLVPPGDGATFAIPTVTTPDRAFPPGEAR